MRFAGLLLLTAATGCSGAAPEPATGGSWAANRAARITHDRKKNEFILTNVSNQTLWFDGESNLEKTASPRPDPVYQRQMASGWVNSGVTLAAR
jgi:hypothetical protein